MILPYPQSIPCAFDGFPAALDIRLGDLGGDIVTGASLGTKFTLLRTPLCGIAQGVYAAGAPLPEYSMIYSDTGSDEDFTIKISFIGHGTFYKYTSTDAYLRFQVYKAIAIETASGEKVFGDTFDCETLVPAAQDADPIFPDIGQTGTSDNTSVFDYIVSMEPLNIENATAEGSCVLAISSVGTATCGVVGLATLQAITTEATADWAPIGLATLPAIAAMGTTDGYRPAWGELELPALIADGAARMLIESVSLLPPLYATGSTGVVGSVTAPIMAVSSTGHSFSAALANITLPKFSATGMCGFSARASLMLPAATGTGLVGARASALLSALTATGAAKEAVTARGDVSLPALDATGATGATGATTMAKLKAMGSCGMSASGKANFPALAMNAFAWVENSTWGDVDFPALTATGRAVQGRVAAGVGILPALRSTGRATQGPLARGAVIFPRLRATGVSLPLFVSVGDIDISPLVGRGHAVNAASWTGILSYDSTRLM